MRLKANAIIERRRAGDFEIPAPWKQQSQTTVPLEHELYFATKSLGMRDDVDVVDAIVCAWEILNEQELDS